MAGALVGPPTLGRAAAPVGQRAASVAPGQVHGDTGHRDELGAQRRVDRPHDGGAGGRPRPDGTDRMVVVAP